MLYVERPKQQYFLHSDTPNTSTSIYYHLHEQPLQHVHHNQEIPMPHTHVMSSYNPTSIYSRSTTNNMPSYSYYSREQSSISLPPPPNTFLPSPLPPPSTPPSSSSQQQQH